MNIICTFYIKPLCSGIIVDLNVFSATVSKQKTAHKAVIVQNMHVSRSNHAIYLRWHATFPCTTLEKMTIAHSACEKSIRFSIPINTDHRFVNASLPKPKYEPFRHSVAYYRCILLPNVLDIRIPRGQAVVYANCLSFRRDLPALLPRFLPNYEKPLDVDYKCELPVHAS